MPCMRLPNFKEVDDHSTVRIRRYACRKCHPDRWQRWRPARTPAGRLWPNSDLIHLFRLIDAPQFKTQLAASHAEFALITSDYLYTEVIQHGPGLIEPAAYQLITVTNKETQASAWTWRPSTAVVPAHRGTDTSSSRESEHADRPAVAAPTT